MKSLLFTLMLMLSVGVVAGQQPQTQTAPISATNAKYVNGVAPGYAPTAGSGLTLYISGGTSFCSGTVVQYAAGNLTMTASTTNYVYLNTSSSCVPAVKTSTFVTADIPVAIVVTSGSAISSITDVRTSAVSQSSPNLINGSTSTTLNGLLTGNGTVVGSLPLNTYAPGPASNYINTNPTLSQTVLVAPGTTFAVLSANLPSNESFQLAGSASNPFIQYTANFSGSTFTSAYKVGPLSSQQTAGSVNFACGGLSIPSQAICANANFYFPQTINGNASTATGFFSTPSLCNSSPSYGVAVGVTVSGNPICVSAPTAGIFTQPYIGGTTTASLNGVVQDYWFGATGSGADETTALQNALNSIGNGCLQLNPGTHMISGTLTITRQNVSICPPPGTVGVLQTNNASGTMLSVAGTASSNVIENLQLIRTVPMANPLVRNLSFDGVNNPFVRNIYSQNGQIYFHQSNSALSEIHNLNCSWGYPTQTQPTVGEYACVFTDSSDGHGNPSLNITGIYTQEINAPTGSTGYAWVNKGAFIADVRVHQVLSSIHMGVAHIECTTGCVSSSDILLDDFVADQNIQGVLVKGLSASTGGGLIISNGFVGSQEVGTGCQVEIDNSSGVIFVNNDMYAGSSSGLCINNSTSIISKGNFIGVFAAPVTLNGVTNSTFDDVIANTNSSAAAQIALTNTSVGNRFAGRVDGISTYGVSLDASSTANDFTVAMGTGIGAIGSEFSRPPTGASNAYFNSVAIPSAKVPNVGFGGGNFVPSINNPNIAGVPTVGDVFVNGSGLCEAVFATYLGTAYTSASDDYCENWSAPTYPASLQNNYGNFVVRKVGSTYYGLGVSNQSGSNAHPNNTYLLSATTLAGPWTMLNGGNPVFTGSSNSTDKNYSVFNVSFAVVGSTWYFTWEGGTQSEYDVYMGSSYSTTCPSACNFNTNAVVASTGVNFFNGFHSPDLKYNATYNSLVMTILNQTIQKPGYSGAALEVYTIPPSTSTFGVASDWTQAPGFEMWYEATQTPISDPRLTFTTPGVKPWNGWMSYDLNSGPGYQAYSNLTFDQWYVAVTNPLSHPQLGNFINQSGTGKIVAQNNSALTSPLLSDPVTQGGNILENVSTQYWSGASDRVESANNFTFAGQNGGGISGYYTRTPLAPGSHAITGTVALNWFIPGGPGQGLNYSVADDMIDFLYGCKYFAPGNQRTDTVGICPNSGSRPGLYTTLPITGQSLTATGPAAAVSAGQISFGGVTAAASNCNAGGVLTGVVGCLVVNVAGTTHYTPYF